MRENLRACLAFIAYTALGGHANYIMDMASKKKFDIKGTVGKNNISVYYEELRCSVTGTRNRLYDHCGAHEVEFYQYDQDFFGLDKSNRGFFEGHVNVESGIIDFYDSFAGGSFKYKVL
ncbi:MULTISPECIES: hypothetical protein [unclassified Vibrio]|uniref:hypothetical protein n=1 Tax=unclassified Vibrio TaxID=2614977 RepID=UPI001361CDF3|nr:MULTISPECIES: hypothetical protein [unclassified Vibrio]NAW60104.1 hypothetical protein [Vibrio sp. V36_P2S2PM302]NAX26731.1 hypothetical protein [Vibrio sp. V38_P2S17PM301]